MIRPALFAGLALLSAAAFAPAVTPAFAGEPLTGGIPLISAPLASTNISNATNVAAGIGNSAGQQVLGLSMGRPGGLVSTNVGTATNVAAGIGNTANQQVFGLQSGGGFGGRGFGGVGNQTSVGLSFGRGRGAPLVTTNVGTATNVAAGIGNRAGQQVTGIQH